MNLPLLYLALSLVLRATSPIDFDLENSRLSPELDSFLLEHIRDFSFESCFSIISTSNAVASSRYLQLLKDHAPYNKTFKEFCFDILRYSLDRLEDSHGKVLNSTSAMITYIRHDPEALKEILLSRLSYRNAVHLEKLFVVLKDYGFPISNEFNDDFYRKIFRAHIEALETYLDNPSVDENEIAQIFLDLRLYNFKSQDPEFKCLVLRFLDRIAGFNVSSGLFYLLKYIIGDDQDVEEKKLAINHFKMSWVFDRFKNLSAGNVTDLNVLFNGPFVICETDSSFFDLALSGHISTNRDKIDLLVKVLPSLAKIHQSIVKLKRTVNCLVTVLLQAEYLLAMLYSLKYLDAEEWIPRPLSPHWSSLIDDSNFFTRIFGELTNGNPLELDRSIARRVVVGFELRHLLYLLRNDNDCSFNLLPTELIYYITSLLIDLHI